jgi:enoyl-CoA hydratase/carnithine racemase
VPVGPARLAPLLGEALARDLIFTSRVLGAEEALKLGFVRSLHPPEAAEPAALELAGELAERPPAGLRRMKKLLLDLSDGPARVEHENRELVDFQRHGAGLPRRG